jgi:hypothetical protein
MIRQERIDELKRYDNPREFFDAFSCELNIVEQHREIFEAEARIFGEKLSKYKASVDNLRKELKKPKKPPQFILDILEQYRIQKKKGKLEQCQKKEDIFREYQNKGWKRVTIVLQKWRSGGVVSYYTKNLWVPPGFPDDPSLWFKFGIYNPLYYDKGWGLGKATCLSPEDKLLRSYMALAILFNQQAKIRGETPIAPDILSGNKEPWLGLEIPQEYKTQMENFYWPKVRAVLIDDLETIDRYLANLKPAEEEQKATFSKRWGIKKGICFLVIVLLLILAVLRVMGWPEPIKAVKGIYSFVFFLAAMLTCLHHLGWLERIKRLFTK